MSGIVRSLVVACMLLACVSMALAEGKGDGKVPAVLSFTMNSLDGKSVDLSRYRGKVVLIVNVASQCGFTPQYKGLQALHERFAKDGLVILGFPANNFGQQEPGSDEEIGTFCRSKYGVAFDMFSKVSVKGDDQCPLYRFLTSAETDPRFAGPVKWNFEKFLVGRNGEVAARFSSKVKPDTGPLVEAVEAELRK